MLVSVECMKTNAKYSSILVICKILKISAFSLLNPAKCNVQQISKAVQVSKANVAGKHMI